MEREALRHDSQSVSLEPESQRQRVAMGKVIGRITAVGKDGRMEGKEGMAPPPKEVEDRHSDIRTELSEVPNFKYGLTCLDIRK